MDSNWTLPIVEVFEVLPVDGPIGDGVDQVYAIADDDISVELTAWVHDRELELEVRRTGWEQPLLRTGRSRVVQLRSLDDPGQSFVRILCERDDSKLTVEIATKPHLAIRVYPGFDGALATE